MPHMRYDRRHLMGRGRRLHRGKGLMDWLGKAHNWIRDNKIISNVASVLPGIGPAIGSVAGALGYGRRHHKGFGLGLAGHGRRRRIHHGGFAKVGY